VDQRQVVVRILFPTDQQSAVSVQPTVGTFHHPPLGLVFAGAFSLCLAAMSEVRAVTTRADGLFDLGKIIAFIRTQMLRMLRSRGRPLDDHTIECGG
jgi:hypothetical protein